MFNGNAKHVFAPGFRLSVLDGFILVVGAIATFTLAMTVWWWGFVLGFILGHFLLFCNVVHVARLLELAWAGLFIALAASTVTLDAPGWPVTVSASLIATVVVVAVEMRKPSYHGFGWQWINPGLPDWWERRTGESCGG